MDIQDLVFEEISKQKGIEKQSLNRETTLDQIGLDSLDMVELSLSLEETFQITIEQKDILEIKNLGQAIDFISKKAK